MHARMEESAHSITLYFPPFVWGHQAKKHIFSSDSLKSLALAVLISLHTCSLGVLQSGILAACFEDLRTNSVGLVPTWVAISAAGTSQPASQPATSPKPANSNHQPTSKDLLSEEGRWQARRLKICCTPQGEQGVLNFW